MNIGYCCINLSNPKLKVSRGMIQRTFLARGLPYCSELTIQNLTDLEKIIEWNHSQNINIYRLSSDMFPWMTEYLLDELPNFDLIKEKLSLIGSKIKKYGMRCGFHPGPFNVINSDNPLVVEKTVFELSQHATILDLMGLDESPFYCINVHINSAKPNKEEAANRFVENVKRLSKNVINRLTIENDDKQNLYSVKEVKAILARCHHKIPLVFDNLHHELHPDGETFDSALELAKSTWPQNITPLIHWSSSKKKWEDPTSLQTAHADYVYDKIPSSCIGVDIEVEAKAKDLAILKYKKDYS